MPQPYNYIQNPQSAGFADGIMKSYAIGQQIKQGREQGELNKQIATQNQEKWNIQKNAMELKQTQDKMAYDRKVLGRTKLKELTDSNNANPTDWAKFYGDFPEMQETASKVATVLKLGKDDNTKNLLLRANSALMRKSPETAAKLFRAHGKLYEKTNPDTQEMYEEMANNIMFDQPKAKAYIDMVGFSIFGDKYATKEQTEAKYKKDLATAKLTDAQTKIVGQDADTREKLATNETAKLVIEANKLKKANGGILAPKDRIKLELDLANQYLKEGGDYFERADRAYMNIVNSSETGVGGLNMYLSFMKTIDPGSTVTGGEVVTAKNAPGVVSAFAQKWNSIFKKGSPSKSAKEQFKKEARNIRDNAERLAKRVQKRITNQVKGTNADPANIFSAERESKDRYDLIKNANKPEIKETNNLIGGGIGSDGNLSPTNSTQRASSFLNKYRKN